MRIAQVSPLFESVPPKLYGGTERVVAYLTEELVRQGHEVTLFASGDSRTSARLVATVDRALRLDAECLDPLAHQIVQLHEVFAQAHRFDVIHFHIDYLHYPFSAQQKTPFVTTLHGRLDLPDLQPVYRAFPDAPLVSISDAQRLPLDANLNWWATVHHGLPKQLLKFNPHGGAYFAFLGRISPEKRLDRAIAIARALETPLKVGAALSMSEALSSRSPAAITRLVSSVAVAVSSVVVGASLTQVMSIVTCAVAVPPALSTIV